MSLAYPLSILFLYSYFYTLHIPILIMFISFHVRILCMYHIHSYLVYFHITYLILSCTFIYIIILFIYGTFMCFHPILFMYCTFICLLPVSSIIFIFQFYDLLHSMYYYIYHFLSYTYIMSSFMLSLHAHAILFIYLSLFSTFCTLLVHIFFVYYTLYFLYTVFMYCSFPIPFSCYNFHMAFSFMYLHMLSYTFI